MRDQIKLIFNIGSDYIPDQFKAGVISAAVGTCGGCFVHHGDGYWNDLDETKMDFFRGKPVKEMALVIEVTCEPEKLWFTYEHIKHAIVHEARHWAVDVNWVHVSQIAMTGLHFSVQDEIKRAA